ncbi:hypothetical protein [uncultured Plantibacter sp.]|uniref:hypothetical protein n=1 Tax=uncultured Plantibacter sp. TaxID=293337 RepID=UPI0028D441EF|nr:hypothetical protein [uncultured Plantibacter sp.]
MSDITITRSVRRPAGRLAALIAIPLLIGSLAACASGSPGSEPGSKTPSTVQSFEDWQLAFASCMRDEGVDMPDPGKDGSGAAISLGDADAEAFTAASKTCTDKLGAPPAPAGGDVPVSDRFEEQLQMAECFRENGIDVPDPVKGEAMNIPSDVPEDVLDACGLDMSNGSSLGSTDR